MKPHFRFYTGDRSATFKIGDQSVTLRLNDQFQIMEFKGRVVVVKDGYRYPVAPKLVKELLARSEKADVAKEHAQEVVTFDKLGHTLLKYVVLQATKLAGDGVEVVSGFKNNSVFAKFASRLDTGEVICCLTIRQNAVSAELYSPTKLNITSIAMFEQLRRAIIRIAERMTEKFGTATFKWYFLTSHVANVGTPWGDKFTGLVYSFSSKWNTEAHY